MRKTMLMVVALVGAWSLACSGEVTVNDEPLEVGDEEGEEAEDGDEEGEETEDGEDGEDGEDAEQGEGASRKDVVEALKNLKAKVGDVDASCKDVAGDAKQPIAKWINAQRKSAAKTQIGCEGSTCSVKMNGPSDAEWMVEVTFEMKDGEIDPATMKCTAAG